MCAAYKLSFLTATVPCYKLKILFVSVINWEPTTIGDLIDYYYVPFVYRNDSKFFHEM